MAPKSVEEVEDCYLTAEEEEDVEEEEEAVYMNCICNNNDTCDILSVMCTYCEEGFHARCCGLDEADCNDLESTNMTWACPRCRESQDQSPAKLEALHEEQEVEEEEEPEAEDELEALPEEEEGEGGEASKQEAQTGEVPDLLPVSGVAQEGGGREDIECVTLDDSGEEGPSPSVFQEGDDLLSLTAKLEALHKEEYGENDSFLFAKPMPKTVPMEESVKSVPPLFAGKISCKYAIQSNHFKTNLFR